MESQQKAYPRIMKVKYVSAQLSSWDQKPQRESDAVEIYRAHQQRNSIQRKDKTDRPPVPRAPGGEGSPTPLRAWTYRVSGKGVWPRSVKRLGIPRDQTGGYPPPPPPPRGWGVGGWQSGDPPYILKRNVWWFGISVHYAQFREKGGRFLTPTFWGNHRVQENTEITKNRKREMSTRWNEMTNGVDQKCDVFNEIERIGWNETEWRDRSEHERYRMIQWMKNRNNDTKWRWAECESQWTYQ
jgi:hypothetical protein